MNDRQVGRENIDRQDRRSWARAELLLLLLLALILAGCEVEASEAALIAEGEEVYIMNCSRCHQLDGRGFQPVNPNLAGNPIVTLFDPNLTIDVVLDGRGSMPAYRDRLGPDEMAAVITYIRWAWGNDASAVSPTQMR